MPVRTRKVAAPRRGGQRKRRGAGREPEEAQASVPAAALDMSDDEGEDVEEADQRALAEDQDVDDDDKDVETNAAFMRVAMRQAQADAEEGAAAEFDSSSPSEEESSGEEEEESGEEEDSDGDITPNTGAGEVTSAPVVRAGHGATGATAAQLAAHTDDLESDDEAAGNTIGNVPLEWYDGYDHLGYRVDGSQLLKKGGEDAVDAFLRSQEDADYMWTITDDATGEKYTLSKRDVQLIQNIRSGTYAHPEFNADVEMPEPEPEKQPLNMDPEPKRRFVPSKWEMKRVNAIARLMKAGQWQGSKPRVEEKDRPLFLLWGEDGNVNDPTKASHAAHIPAPKTRLPGHAASYNPPAEYLFTDEERALWMRTPHHKRPLDFEPVKFGALRHVPAYQDAVKERFERCLDLYLFPRAMKSKLRVDPDSLLPKLPDPSELRPFPTTRAVEFVGHKGRIRCMDVSPDGKWLVTGSDDKTVRMWEVGSARCARCWYVRGIVHAVKWNPNPALGIVAVAVQTQVLFISTGTCVAESALEATFDALSGARADDAPAAAVEEAGLEPDAGVAAAEDERPDVAKIDGVASLSLWRDEGLSEAGALRGAAGSGIKVRVECHGLVRKLSWHGKGDYLAAVMPKVGVASVVVHQLTRRVSTKPFRKTHGLIQDVAFHPSKPLFYVASQRTVRVYHLVEQRQVQKLVSAAKWISSIDIHPTGDHVLVGTYDRRVIWFDTELGHEPFKSLRYHTAGVRAVAFHPRYPLMLSASDDGNVHVFHARVYDDFLQNPLLVPVKVLRACPPGEDELGVLASVWHPNQPWLFTGGSDKTALMWQNIP